MADVKRASPDINFLSHDELEGKPGGKFLRWALTWGKRIVVVTELMVILAFLSRFWLDTQVADLADKIDRQKAVVESSAVFERKFRALTDRLAQAQSLEDRVSPLTVYDAAVNIVPAGIAVSRLAVDSQSVNIAGSGSDQSIASLVAAFRTSPRFTGINVERIAKTNLDPAANFSLSAVYVAQKS